MDPILLLLLSFALFQLSLSMPFQIRKKFDVTRIFTRIGLSSLVKRFYKIENDSEGVAPISFFSLFRFATNFDVILMVIGIICTIFASISYLVWSISCLEFTALLVDRTLKIGTSSSTLLLPLFGGGKVLSNATAEENLQEIANDSVAHVILMISAILLYLISTIVGIYCFNRAALQQITRIRIKFFKSLMRQEIGWYDVTGGNNNFAVNVTIDMEKIRDGISEKMYHFLEYVILFVLKFAISCIYGWKLARIALPLASIFVALNLIIAKVQAKLLAKELSSYSAAANVAEEVLSGIRTVFAFGGENMEIERYNSKLLKAKNAVKVKGFFNGLANGTTTFLMVGIYALAFSYGVQFVLDNRSEVNKEFTPAVLMITNICLIGSVEHFAGIIPFFTTFAAACASAATIFRIIDRTSKIDSMSNEGDEPFSGVQGNVALKRVFFSYPSRPDVQILRGLNLEIQSGESVALVGHSGNGKSTCLQLLQRFYDPDEGQVLIDGRDIRTLNIHTLRSSIAIVEQDPILFSTTIEENIRYGKPNATNEDIIAAAQMSGAHDFIVYLPQGYNTLVGERGSKLSGGQKQRIAIARALIQNAKILLLDEATSALDYESEKLVHETLKKVSKERTTITVSHRLSAIQNANRILFIENGQVIEDGTHSQLMTMNGRYYEMITAGISVNSDDRIPIEIHLNANEKHESQQKETVKSLCNVQKDDQKHIQNFPADDVEGEVEKSEQNIKYWNVFKRILILTKPDWFNLFLAVICACISGAATPVFTILISEIYGTLSMEDTSAAHNNSVIICIVLMAVAVLTFITSLFQSYLFSKASINLAMRVRSMMFASLMRQECSWYDEQNHSSAELSARLAGDANALQELIEDLLNTIVRFLSTCVVGVIISFSLSIKLSLVALGAMPLVLIAVLLEARHMSKMTMLEKESIEIETKIATEALKNIRTIASLKQERHMIDRYTTEMRKVTALIRKKLIWRGLVSSAVELIPLIGNAIALFYGGFLVVNGEIHFKNMIKVTRSLVTINIIMSNALVLVPSFTGAFVAAYRIFHIIDRVPMIASPIVANKSRKPDEGNDIEYKKIGFRYPTRSSVQVLKDFNLNIFEGKTVALVGPSGCGKTTCIQLLQRLYDPECGRIHIGLDEISSDISIEGLRSKLSIVSQDPVLFDRTIAENIAYGDNSRKVSMDEIMAAAQLANVHNFIIKLPMGYETNVGSKTAQLSGGQKQRIAIARALVRNPKILLLDEATSSLDLHSEQVVQTALDSARSGRTCLVIAHRLSTIRNCDAICVLHGGKIVEQGTHNELLALGGIYTCLYNAQM